MAKRGKTRFPGWGTPTLVLALLLGLHHRPPQLLFRHSHCLLRRHQRDLLGPAGAALPGPARARRRRNVALRHAPATAVGWQFFLALEAAREGPGPKGGRHRRRRVGRLGARRAAGERVAALRLVVRGGAHRRQDGLVLLLGRGRHHLLRPQLGSGLGRGREGHLLKAAGRGLAEARQLGGRAHGLLLLLHALQLLLEQDQLV